jgi:DNA excision repair protein ERCC-3
MAEQKAGLDELVQERVKFLIEQVINVVPALKELTGITDEARKAVEQQVTDFALSIKTSKLDKDQLEVFFRKPYYLEPVPRRPDSWYLIIPKFVDVRFGWLEPSGANESYNRFLLNRYMDWLGEIPQAIKKQLNWKAPPELTLDGEELHGTKEAMNYAWQKFRPLLHDRDETRIKINSKRAFELIAQLVKDGILPFSIKPVDPADLVERRCDFKLREYQQQAWEELKKYSAVGIFYPPSTGKTVIGLWVMTHLKPRHLVVVPTKLLQEQWLERIATHTDLQPDEYAVMTYQSAIAKASMESWTTKVIDEVHHLPADTFVKLALIKAKYTIGLSASPFREDGREEYVFALSGKPVGLSWEYFKKLSIIKSPTCHVWILKNFDAKLKRLESLLEEDRRTIIFSDSIQVGETIKAKFKIPFVNGLTEGNMETINANRTVVVSRVGDEGMSLPDIERVIEVSWLGGCYDAQTEVLTEDGWKLFEKLTGYDRVATLNPSGGIEYCKPEAYQKFMYKGRMVRFKGRSYDLLLTPYHNMYVRNAKNSRGFYFTQADNLVSLSQGALRGRELCRSGTWVGVDREAYVLPEPKLTEYVRGQKQLYEKAIMLKKDGLSDTAIAIKLQVNYFTVHYWLKHDADPLNRQKRLAARTEVPLEPFLKLLAWYVSEGSIGHERAVKLAQMDQPHRSEIIRVVKDCGYEPHEGSGHISIYSKQLAQCLATEAGKGAEAKHLPRWLFSLPSYRLRIFLTELLKGDGGNGRKYYTGSTQLGNDVQELALKCGYAATIIVRNKRNAPLLRGRPIIARLPQIEVYISYVQLTPQIWTEPTTEEYKGLVFCLTVPNHTLYVRRNGRAVWCGNSRRQELQRTTRLLHSQTDEQVNHVLMTLEEYLRDRKRLFAIMDKGFKIVLHREGVSEKIIQAHEESGYMPPRTRISKKEEVKSVQTATPSVPAPSGQSATFLNLPGVQKILGLLSKREKQLFILLLDHDGEWFSKEKLPLLLGYTSVHSMHRINFAKMVDRGWIEKSCVEGVVSFRTNMRGKVGGGT